MSVSNGNIGHPILINKARAFALKKKKGMGHVSMAYLLHISLKCFPSDTLINLMCVRK